MQRLTASEADLPNDIVKRSQVARTPPPAAGMHVNRLQNENKLPQLSQPTHGRALFIRGGSLIRLSTFLFLRRETSLRRLSYETENIIQFFYCSSSFSADRSEFGSPVTVAVCVCIYDPRARSERMQRETIRTAWQ